MWNNLVSIQYHQNPQLWLCILGLWQKSLDMFLDFTHYSTHIHTQIMHSHLKGRDNVLLASTQHRLPRPLHDENGVSCPILAKLMSAWFAFGMEERKHYFDTWEMSPSSWRKSLTYSSEINTATTKYNSRRFHKYICIIWRWLWRNGFPPLSRTGAHLYSQKVSSFISCDSTSGWRSSFSFTADEVEEIFFCFVFCNVMKAPTEWSQRSLRWLQTKRSDCLERTGQKRRRSHATGGRPCQKEMFAVGNKEICTCRLLIGYGGG